MTCVRHEQMEMDYMQQGNMSHEHMIHEKMGHDHMMHEKMGHDHMVHGKMDHEHMIYGNMGHKHMMHGDMEHNKMHHMSSYFALHFQGDFLIKDVNISAPSGLVLAMLLVMVLTALLEGINYWVLLKQTVRPASFVNNSQVDGSLHVLYAIHKMLTVALSYTVMLCVMSMNAWIFVSAVIGAGFGYLLLRPAVASCFPVSVPVKNVREDKVAANRVNGTGGTEEGEMDIFLEEDYSKNANNVIHSNFPTDGLLQNYTCVETV